MKNLTFFLLLFFLLSCSSNTSTDNHSAEISAPDSLSTFSEYKITKIFYTLPDGNVLEKAMDITLTYNNSELKVDFIDSIWQFEITSIEKKTEGTTIQIKDKRFKKYKEVFIAAGDLPIITFSTFTETGNLTLM